MNADQSLLADGKPLQKVASTWHKTFFPYDAIEGQGHSTLCCNVFAGRFSGYLAGGPCKMLTRLLAPALATATAAGVRSSFSGSTAQLLRTGARVLVAQQRQLTCSPICMGR